MEGLNPRLGFAIAAGALGSAFQHGYHTGVLNAPQQIIEGWVKTKVCPEVVNHSLQLDPEAIRQNLTHPSDWVSGGWEELDTACNTSVTLIWSWTVAIFCIGGMMGGSLCGFVSSKLGRKGGLLANNILVFVAAGLMTGAKSAGSYEMLIAGRLVIGINSGLNAGLCPMYLSEISPTSLRGALGTVYQLIVTISILLSQVLGMNNVLGTESGWPWLVSINAIFAIFQVATLPFCPESPKYLLLDKDDTIRAENSLQWLRGTIEVHREMDEMKKEQEASRREPKVTLRKMLTTPSLRKPLIIANMMMLAQQLSGINAAMFFSTKIFQSAGLDEAASQSATLGMGTVNVAMTFVSLALIERLGRKTLMLAGLTEQLLSTVLLLASLLTFTTVPAMSYVAVAAVIFFVVGFATGPGSIPWFFVTELFTMSGRSTATSMAVTMNWAANFLVGLSFQPIQMLAGVWVFMVFIVIQILFIIYVFLVVPETKGRTIEEITAAFRK